MTSTCIIMNLGCGVQQKSNLLEYKSYFNDNVSPLGSFFLMYKIGVANPDLLPLNILIVSSLKAFTLSSSSEGGS